MLFICVINYVQVITRKVTEEG